MNKKTIILISIAALIIFVFGYAWYSTRNNPEQTAVAEITEVGKIVLTKDDIVRVESGKKILTLLGDLSKANIDITVFESAVFKSLKDFSQKLPVAEKGRTNPFAPFSASTIVTSSAPTTSTASAKTPVKSPSTLPLPSAENEWGF